MNVDAQILQNYLENETVRFILSLDDFWLFEGNMSKRKQNINPKRGYLDLTFQTQHLDKYINLIEGLESKPAHDITPRKERYSINSDGVHMDVYFRYLPNNLECTHVLYNNQVFLINKDIWDKIKKDLEGINQILWCKEYEDIYKKICLAKHKMMYLHRIICETYCENCDYCPTHGHDCNGMRDMTKEEYKKMHVDEQKQEYNNKILNYKTELKKMFDKFSSVFDFIVTL